MIAFAQSPVVGPPPACWCPTTDGAPFLLVVLLAFFAVVGVGCVLTAAYDAGARRGWWPA